MAHLKIDQKFLDYLRNKAKELEDDAGYGGRMDDGGACHLRELICAYEAGRDTMIPVFWIAALQTFNDAADPEYQTYLKLKEKFERK